jgi:sugar phosphate isomerase/epimerase
LQHEGGRWRTVAVGDGVIPYAEIFRALAGDGYRHAVSMETHFRLNGSREEASRRSMKGILAAIEG